ncbi:MAG: preprotein translocase subunit SecA [Eubacterium sp.]|nr:preprotein translocase subunit SecA [Eubacterium sp.]
MILVDKLFGTYSDRELKKIEKTVDAVMALESKYSDRENFTDDMLRAKTDEFKKLLAEGKTLDDILVDAFAVVREAAWRVLGMRPYRVQVIGGIILHQGRLAEMRTGEGKTLVSTMPAYLNALEGKGVHIVTVNDYLALRDSEWMGRVHEFLGLTVSAVLQSFSREERQAAYKCDITYITNNELGFDYLRDNMVTYKEQLVQRGLHYAIIDEIDSILIDEARTPLIISGRGSKPTDLYKICNNLAKRMQRGTASTEITKAQALMGEQVEEDGDYLVNEKDNFIVFTEQGVKNIENYLDITNLTEPEHIDEYHCMLQAVRAHALMHRDKDYIVKDGEVLIVDEFTGRVMPGRRFSDGLHQALEAKEAEYDKSVKVNRENKTLATITFQNFFNKYDKKAGMTGTAQTEETEFREIYGMDVVVIPPNRPVARDDQNDSLYATKLDKYNAVVKAVVEAHSRKQPVLVGTADIAVSEEIDAMLRKKGIHANVLNAKHHDKEAEIVAEAGRIGAVTIATNMAGRGTDIVLGGNPEKMAEKMLKDKGLTIEEASDEELKEALAEAKKIAEEEAPKVKELGGLKVIGTERHESRRIDNQLRGRSGRQGDPGDSKFYLSLEDDLLRLFGAERTMETLKRLSGDEGGEIIENKMVTKAIETAQKRLESNHYGTRKSLLEYDQVNNEQREVIYAERRKVLDGENMHDTVREMIEETAEKYIGKYVSDEIEPEEWDIKSLTKELARTMPPQREDKVVSLEPTDKEKNSGNAAEYTERVTKEMLDAFETFCDDVYEDDAQLQDFERMMIMRAVDTKWMEQIDDMEQLRQGIGLQGYGNKDPLVEYKMAGFDMFNEMIGSIREQVAFNMTHFRPRPKEEAVREQVVKETGTNKDETIAKGPVVNKTKKIGRNDLCPCGSGKKYKNCHLPLGGYDGPDMRNKAE